MEAKEALGSIHLSNLGIFYLKAWLVKKWVRCPPPTQSQEYPAVLSLQSPPFWQSWLKQSSVLTSHLAADERLFRGDLKCWLGGLYVLVVLTMSMMAVATRTLMFSIWISSHLVPSQPGLQLQNTFGQVWWWNNWFMCPIQCMLCWLDEMIDVF